MFSRIIWQMMAQSQHVIFTNQKGNVCVHTHSQSRKIYCIICLSLVKLQCWFGSSCIAQPLQRFQQSQGHHWYLHVMVNKSSNAVIKRKVRLYPENHIWFITLILKTAVSVTVMRSGCVSPLWEFSESLWVHMSCPYGGYQGAGVGWDQQPGFGLLCLLLLALRAGMPSGQTAHFKCQWDVSKIISF